MAGATLAIEAILLARRDSGEHGLLLTFLAPEHGLLSAFKRTSARSRQPLPDLFDEVSLTLQRGQGADLWFVSEYLIQRRRPGIGANYRALAYASRYALLLTHHLFESGEAPELIERLRQALDAWEEGVRPEAAYFKAIYLFARQQGFPVREEWMETIDKADSHQALTVLRQPLAAQTEPPPVVERLIAGFERYLYHSHDVRFGETE